MNTVFLVIGIVFLIIAIVSYSIQLTTGKAIEISPTAALTILLVLVTIILVAYSWNH